ncbi:hypothetical protein [Flavobacterium sp.]|uniref:DUF6929 family protein n=1 Tax=Flavobacterium sp. TaxID=239 RepID=UPI002622E8B0|nr:hypothetical protein [Flavobacterium sp.]
MKFTAIQNFGTVHGIHSSSGLLWLNDYLFCISDNSDFLFKINPTNFTFEAIPTIENAQHWVEKKHKRDYEIIYADSEGIHLYGSGSKEKRKIKTSFADLENLAISTECLLYDAISSRGISDDDLNLEALCKHDDTYYIFNRGNGPMKQNRVFKARKLTNGSFEIVSERDIQLYFNNLDFTFTDACVCNDFIVFTAAAEASDSTYLDGEIGGSLLGVLKIDSLEVLYTQIVSQEHKFEGITCYKSSETTHHFYLAEDNDRNDGALTMYGVELEL